MVENESGSLSKALLENQDSDENVRVKGEESAGLTQSSVRPSVGVEDGLIEKAQIMKSMIEQEANSQQEDGLEIDKIELILTEILDLERLRPMDQRLNQDEIIAFTATIFNKNYTEGRIQMTLEEASRLESDLNLKKIIQDNMKEHSTLYRAGKKLYRSKVVETSSKDISEAKDNSQQEDGLEIDKIDLILTEILDLNELKPEDKKLNYDKIIVLAATIFKEKYPEDRLQMILEEVRRLESELDLKKSIQDDMKDHPTLCRVTKPHEPEVFETVYEDIIEAELSRILKSDFNGHSGAVTSVAVSSDCRFIVSGSSDKTIKLWNIKERREEFTFIGHTRSVLSVAVSPDSRYIVSGSQDTTVKLWSIQERREKFTFIGHHWGVRSVSVSADSKFIISMSSHDRIKLWNTQELREVCTIGKNMFEYFMAVMTADGKYVVSGTYDIVAGEKLQKKKKKKKEITEKDLSVHTISLWDIQAEEEKWRFAGHSGEVRSVAVSSDSRFIVSGSHDNTVKLLIIQEQREEFTFVGHTSGVNSVAISVDCRFIVSGSLDKTIKVWNIQERREEYTLEGHTSFVSSVALTADGKHIVSGSLDSTIKIWNLQKPKKTDCTFPEPKHAATSVAASGDGRFLVSGLDIHSYACSYCQGDNADDDSIQLWNIEEVRRVCTFSRYTMGYMRSAVMTSDSRFIVSGSEDMTIKLWNIQKRREECRFTGHTGIVRSVVVSTNGRFVVSGSEDKTIKIWNIFEKKEECTFIGHISMVLSVAISTDSTFIVSGSEDCTIKVWNIDKQKEECTFTGHTLGVSSVAVSKDDRFIASGSMDKSIKLWNIQQRREEWTFVEHLDAVLSVAISSDCRFIVSGSSDKTVKVWNIQERRVECTFTGHTDHVRSVAMCPYGRFIVSVSADTCIKLWNMKELREECILTRHASLIWPVAVSTDGRMIVSGCCANTLKLWNIEERREAFTFTGHTNYVTSVVISTDGRIIVSASEDNTIKVWNVHEQKEEFTFSGLKKIQRVIISSDGKFIVSKEADGTVKIWNIQTKEKERFLLKQHSGLLKYILEISNLKGCQAIVKSDFLLLKYELEIVHIARINNGDLQFCFDLGVNNSNRGLIDDNFQKHLLSPKALAISPEYANEYNGILRFSLAHFFSYSGSGAKLKILVENANFTIAVDAFQKSPFYYALAKKRQDCVDILLEKIGDMRLKNPKNHALSILAIRNDFLLILKNSSRQVHHLLLGLLSSSSLINAKLTENLPILQLSLIQIPLVEDFPQDGLEEIPIVLQHSIIPLIGEIGCEYNTTLLDAIINCKNSQAIRSAVINYIVELQFNAIRPWVIGYTVLLSFNIILLMLLIGLKSFNVYFVLPFSLVNAVLITWEVVQMSTDAKGYLEDYWNCLDIVRILTTVSWMALELSGLSSLYFTWSVALINLLRGITVFRLFDGTRFYIELILRSLNDIKYFFLMFAYSTFTFGFLLMISRDEGLGFASVWGESYDLNFGNYEDVNSGVYFLQYFAYFGATVINVVLMLNLLISILGDSYERFQLEQSIVDIKEKARISMELQLMMFWVNKQPHLKFIRLCNSAFQDEEDQDWEGRIRFMDKKLDKSIKELIESNTIAGNKANDSSKAIETNINNSSTLLEGKITSVEGNISDIRSSLEGNINEIRSSLEGKISSVEDKMTSIESKMSDRSILLEDKMNELNNKLEIILSIISK